MRFFSISDFGIVVRFLVTVGVDEVFNSKLPADQFAIQRWFLSLLGFIRCGLCCWMLWSFVSVSLEMFILWVAFGTVFVLGLSVCKKEFGFVDSSRFLFILTAILSYFPFIMAVRP